MFFFDPLLGGPWKRSGGLRRAQSRAELVRRSSEIWQPLDAKIWVNMSYTPSICGDDHQTLQHRILHIVTRTAVPRTKLGLMTIPKIGCVNRNQSHSHDHGYMHNQYGYDMVTVNALVQIYRSTPGANKDKSNRQGNCMLSSVETASGDALIKIEALQHEIVEDVFSNHDIWFPSVVYLLMADHRTSRPMADMLDTTLIIFRWCPPGQLCFVLLQWWRKLPTSALVVDQVVATQKCTPEWPELMIWELQTKRPQLDLTSARVNRQYTIYRPPARPKQIPLCSEGVSPTLHAFAWSDSHLKISHQTGSLGVSGT